ncbi:hypothetical protein O4U37_21600 [Escherichia coli]
MNDKKLSDIYFEKFYEHELYPVKKRDDYLQDLLKEELQNIPEEKYYF